MDQLRLHYIFDPLCNWCYAAAPALKHLAATYPDSLEFMPSGLYAGVNVRPASHGGESVWNDDKRIQDMTAQPFSEAYRANILHGRGVVLDSGPAYRALTAVRDLSAGLEAQLLFAMQHARYVEGLDTAQPAVLGVLAHEVAAAAGMDLDADAVASRVIDDAALADATQARIAASQSLIRRLRTSGVPQLFVRLAGQEAVLQGVPLYEGPNALQRALDVIQEKAEKPV